MFLSLIRGRLAKKSTSFFSLWIRTRDIDTINGGITKTYACHIERHQNVRLVPASWIHGISHIVDPVPLTRTSELRF